MHQWFERHGLANVPLKGEDCFTYTHPMRTVDDREVSGYVRDLIRVNGRSDLDPTTTWLFETFVSRPWQYDISDG